METSNLKELENKSIYIIREVKSRFKNPAIMCSFGKDSTVLLYLIKKAFNEKIPFKVIHIDTSFKFPEIYKFRDKLVKEWNIDLIIAKNENALKNNMNPKKGRFKCCHQLKTEALKQCIEKNKFDVVLAAIRRDEHGIRGKEQFFCFPKGTLIYGNNIKPIEEIKPGDSVFTHLGSLRKVLAVSSRPYRGKLLAIKTEYNNMPILMTPNHVVLAKVAGKGRRNISIKLTGFDGVTREVRPTLKGRRRVVWTKASKLKISDLLYMPKLPKKSQDRIKTLHSIPIRNIVGDHSGLVSKKKQLFWKSAHESAKKIRGSVPLTPDMLRVIGYYVAEGSANLSSNQFSFVFNISESDLVDDILKVMKETFDISGKVRKKGNSFEILFSSKTLTLFFSGICGKGARNKKLPYFFTLLSKGQLAELIKGCWLGDGSNERYSTVSYYLAHQLRLALLRFKILSSIIKDKDSRYHLTIAGTSKNRFSNIFGIKCKVNYISRCIRAKEIKELHSSELSGTNYGRAGSGGFWLTIKKIERIPYSGIVYDFRVEGHSSYLANGLAVHNSPRDKNFRWRIAEENTNKESDSGLRSLQDPEFSGWGIYATYFGKETNHVRCHPLLHWTEKEIWQYIKENNIPIISLYFAKNKKRYRSIGCECCCSAIKSDANTIDKIIKELETTKIQEREGRAQDKESTYIMQKLRSLGYMNFFIVSFLLFKLF